MTRLFPVVACSLVALGCKREEVPFKPLAKEDAHVRPIDAAPPADAAVAPAVTTAAKIVVGDHVSCALMTDATLRCWGHNADGQLGNGTTTDSATPVTPKLHGVKDIVLGTAHACALLDDESVTCWGRIRFGNRESLLVPTAAPGVAKAKRLFAVGGASCATVEGGALVCWGDIDVEGHLALSDGKEQGRVPTPAEGLDRVVALTTNGALKEDGTVWFWGSDGKPVRTALADVVEIASSGDEVCGLRRDGSVACAGPATRCAAAAPKPAAVGAAPKPPGKKQTVKKPAAKQGAKPAQKHVTKGKTGTGATGEVAMPESGQLLPIEVLRLPPATHLAFDVGLCVVTRTGKLQCLSGSDGCKLDAPWPGLASVDDVTGNCARLTDGNARCWAVDSKSRLVRAVAGVGGALAVAASPSHACALLGDRSVVCWGSNKSGALGRGETDDRSHPEARPVMF